MQSAWVSCRRYCASPEGSIARACLVEFFFNLTFRKENITEFTSMMLSDQVSM